MMSYCVTDPPRKRVDSATTQATSNLYLARGRSQSIGSAGQRRARARARARVVEGGGEMDGRERGYNVRTVRD